MGKGTALASIMAVVKCLYSLHAIMHAIHDVDIRSTLLADALT